MHSNYRDAPWQSSSAFWLRLLGRHLPIVTFLLLSIIGMIIVYWYFSPVSASLEAFTAVAGDDSLSAPIFKVVPAEPVVQRLAQSSGPIRIGLISGHKGNDSGTVCADGLTEAEVNAHIVDKVAANLQDRGVRVDILAEFDGRLASYRATAVLSIHADSCVYVNELATGFKLAGSSFTDSGRLADCVQQAYRDATQLPYHANTITPHMTDYHAFRQLPGSVPAIILEVGFMNLDRQLLTVNADIPALGITNGILCYLNRN